ncbi:9516_t:CDS:2 [Scutellospora calospora]|uniref:9516_t:CDS:1 n=1 Tax=Scutellospora calospora TaxID=85575 RepID=A0ACA9JZA3_9GLOM|nr:9516_t:CDS:2 [Scutellospora calospora]
MKLSNTRKFKIAFKKQRNKELTKIVKIFEFKKQQQTKDKFYIESIFNTQKNISKVVTILKNFRETFDSYFKLLCF